MRDLVVLDYKVAESHIFATGFFLALHLIIISQIATIGDMLLVPCRQCALSSSYARLTGIELEIFAKISD